MTLARTDVANELLKRGISLTDIEISLTLGQFITNVDRIGFPDNPLQIHFNYKASQSDFIAEYNYKNSYYGIYTPNVTEALKRIASELVPFVTRSGKFIPSGKLRPLTISQSIAIVGIHEVRHRVQHELPHISFFRPDSKSTDVVLMTLIEYVPILFENIRTLMRAQKLSEDFISLRTNEYEFDSNVVELYYSHKKIRTKEDVRSVLFAEPL